MSAYADLHYDALHLGGGIGEQVRQELVRRPWLSKRERAEVIGEAVAEEVHYATKDLFNQDVVDEARNEGHMAGEHEIKNSIAGILQKIPADPKVSEIAAAVEEIRAEVA